MVFLAKFTDRRLIIIGTIDKRLDHIAGWSYNATLHYNHTVLSVLQQINKYRSNSCFNDSYVLIVGSIKFTAKIRVMDSEKAEDPSLEVIKLLWMLINKHASDLNEGINK